MKKILALAGVVGSPLVLVLPSVLPKVAFLLLAFIPTLTASITTLVLPLLLIGLLGFLGQQVSDGLLFLM